MGKSKVIRCVRDADGGRMNVRLNGELLEEVESFKYLGSHVAVNGRVDVEVGNRMKEASKCMGGMKSVLSNRALGINIKRRLYKGIVVPTALYGAEMWNVRQDERKRLDVFELRCLRSMVGVTRMERVRNEDVRQRTEVVRKLSERVDQRVLSWNGHMVRVGEEHLMKRVWKAEVSGLRVRGRPRRGWLERVERALGVQGLSVEQGRESARDRYEWKAIVGG